jgi:sugar/nucleoside kinase (ribokinase family)
LIERLVVVGSALVDLVLAVPRLPERGGDVLAGESEVAAGGAVNVLSAATRQGLPAAYGGAHGTGPFGDRVRAALRADGVEVLLPAAADRDTGFCVVLVEPSGERTFATTLGAEAYLTPEQLAALDVHDGDAVYVSGYDLAYPHGPAVAAWLAALRPGPEVLLDPSPLAGEVPAPLLAAALARATWVSCTQGELRVLGQPRRDVGVVVRRGPAGCTVRAPGAGTTTDVPAVQVSAVDTNGAGDVHVGAFLAALSRGMDPVTAAGWANAAAALSVTRRGPATGPTLDQTQELIRRFAGAAPTTETA